MDRDDVLQRGDQIVASIAGSVTGGPQDYELLQLVFSGYPLSRIGPLLESSTDQVVRTGVIIVSEAVASVGQLPPQIVDLLAHPDEGVRYYAVQAVSAAGTAAPDEASAAAVSLIDDASQAVRRSVVRFFAGAPVDQLSAMVTGLSTRWRARISLLVASGSDSSMAEAIVEQLASEGSDRLVGLAAAIRHAAIDPTPLKLAADGPDPEVREIALHELRIRDARNDRD